MGLEGNGKAVDLGSVTDFLVCLLPCHLNSPSLRGICQK